MTPPSVYRFAVVSSRQLPPGDSRDLFRFSGQGEPSRLSSFSPPPRMILEVIDRDRNRQINTQDQFFYRSSQGMHLALSPDTGLRLLNYFADPRILRKNNLGMMVESDLLPSNNSFDRSAEGALSDVQGLSQTEREEILETHFPYWEAEGHINLDILEGIRIYTEEENSRWTDIIRGAGIYFRKPYRQNVNWQNINWRYLQDRVLIEKGAVAAGFIVGEYAFNPFFMWHMYTTNFFSMVGGSFFENTRREGIMSSGYLIANGSSYTPSHTRRLINMQMADARSRIAEDHLYWTVTWPVVVAACFADPNFRRFWPAPWRLPRFNVLYNHFASQFSRAIPAIGRTPVGIGMLLASGYGIYEVSSLWFDVYGGLRQGTAENRVFSGVSTVLTEAALLSRASSEMQALTGLGSLSWNNLMRLRALNPRLGVEANMGRMNFFGLRVPMPHAHLVAEIPASPAPAAPGALTRVGVSVLERAAVAEGAPLLEAVAAAPRVAAAETVLTRAAALAPEARVAAPLAEEAVVVAETVLLRSRVRVVGLPLLALAVGVGVGLGLCYVGGCFDDHETPRNLLRDLTGR